MTPKKAMIAVGHRAIMHSYMRLPEKLSNLKPGEFIERYATEEEKNALKELTSEDAQSMIRI